ncbi:MAG: uracil-DNA glycosylase [Candidatus Eisenbacteria bacterium]|nr:uracil-DNA glycosylase [Candidatus Eisenbacteria bacterium]
MSGAPTIASIARAVVECERCARLRDHCRRVAIEKRRAFRDETYWGRPVPGFGDPGARLLVVGLAPAAHGANRTGRMFTGDSSGDWLYEALHQQGFASQRASISRRDSLVLSDAYVTAAVRCAPPDNRPTREELASCRDYLEAEIRALTRVRVVVTMGAIAHQAWLRASGAWDVLAPSERPRFSHGGESEMRDGITLISSYHPSRQNTQTGRLTRVMWIAVFARAREVVDGGT